MSKQTAMINYADATANLFAEFVRYAGGSKKAIEKFCNQFELNMEKSKDRKLAREILEKAQSEIAESKEGQKSGNTGTDRDSPRSNRTRVEDQIVSTVSSKNDKGVFGAKKGSKTFHIDNLLVQGKHTEVQIVEKSGASLETVKRRIRELKSKGITITESKKHQLKVVSK